MSDAAYGLWPLVFLNTAASWCSASASSSPAPRHRKYDGFLHVMSVDQEWAADYAARTPGFIPSLRSQPRLPAGRP